MDAENTLLLKLADFSSPLWSCLIRVLRRKMRQGLKIFCSRWSLTATVLHSWWLPVLQQLTAHMGAPYLLLCYMLLLFSSIRNCWKLKNIQPSGGVGIIPKKDLSKILSRWFTRFPQNKPIQSYITFTGISKSVSFLGVLLFYLRETPHLSAIKSFEFNVNNVFFPLM